MKKYIFIVIGIVAIYLQPIIGQVLIKGAVYNDIDSTSVEYASITVLLIPNSIIIGKASSDVVGKFEIKNLVTHPQYHINISRIGFADYSTDIYFDNMKHPCL
jgi:hypothetical protein